MVQERNGKGWFRPRRLDGWEWSRGGHSVGREGPKSRVAEKILALMQVGPHGRIREWKMRGARSHFGGRSSDARGIALNEGIGAGAGNGGEITHGIAGKMHHVADDDQG